MVKIWTPFVGSVGQFRGFRLSFWRPGSIGKLLPEGLLCKVGLKNSVRHMSVRRVRLVRSKLHFYEGEMEVEHA